jgi:UDP-N-acetylmuramoyl-L-alanyl-D-glutamate--2,6-diaminopimelate ligase
MKLSELLASVGSDLDVRRLEGGAGATEADPEVHRMVHDTSHVRAGDLFCCVPGQRVDGHDLAPEAVAAGAVAVLVERPLALDVPQLQVASVRAALGPLAAALWGHPSRAMTVVGVTGTSGKTTVTHLLQAVLEAAGMPCGVIGTLSGTHTTPEAPELQARLAAERDAGRRAVAVEVSSHGLDQGRVNATHFAVAVFTNLSQDHLDYHHTMEAYFEAKARVFTPAFTHQAVVCTDDAWGQRLRQRVAATSGITVHPYSLQDVGDLRTRADGSSFTWAGVRVVLPLAGRFNVANAVAAATTARLLGVAPGTIAAGLSTARPVPGRFERVDAGQPFTVMVDYSHKPAALEQALATARELVGPGGTLAVVFGCGGGRDVAKRPLMGQVAARRADRVVVTSDNPRAEDPAAIIADILDGLPAGASVVTEPDRRRAIELAVRQARPGDVVLIAGKGHETYQIVGDRQLPFDDREVARHAIVQEGARQ